MPVYPTKSNRNRYNRYYKKMVRVGGRPFLRRRAPLLKALAIRRTIGGGNQPTFVETFRKLVGSPAVPQQITTNGGVVFSMNINQIPQIAQYSNLYRQYRINWVKVMLLPEYNSFDPAAAVGVAGQSTLPRIVWAINDTPALVPPATEAELLEDNGCKIRTISNKWSCSFRPRPDTQTLFAGGAQNVSTRQKFAQWFNFTEGGAIAPEHFGVSAYISQQVTGAGIPMQFDVYYKVSFSLRDPQ